MSHDDWLRKWDVTINVLNYDVIKKWIGHILLNRSTNIAANMTSTAQATTHVAGLPTTQFFNSNACWQYVHVQMGICASHSYTICLSLDPLALNANNVIYTVGVAAHQLPLF